MHILALPRGRHIPSLWAAPGLSPSAKQPQWVGDGQPPAPHQVMVAPQAASLEGSQMSPESQSHQWQGGLGLASNMTLEF